MLAINACEIPPEAQGPRALHVLIMSSTLSRSRWLKTKAGTLNHNPGRPGRSWLEACGSFSSSFPLLSKVYTTLIETWIETSLSSESISWFDGDDLQSYSYGGG